MVQLSIIIPTFNEEKEIVKLLQHLQNNSLKNGHTEIIIVDGGSTDETISIVSEEVKQSSLTIRLISSPQKGRAYQLNFGAKNAQGKILYFLHADTIPPEGVDEIILQSVTENCQAGSFQMSFDKDTLFFNFWSWFTKFKWDIASGGDQSLFITQKLFNKINGFNENWKVMEDIEIIPRIKAATKYIKLPQKVITSTRKYNLNGAYKLQFIFFVLHLKKMLGYTPDRLAEYYKKKVK